MRHALVLMVAALFAAPFVYLLGRNLGEPGQFIASLADAGLAGSLGRTLLLGATVAAGATVIGTAAAWVVARTDVPARTALAVLLALPLVIPSFIGAFALIAAFATGGLLERLLAPLGVGSLPSVQGFWAAAAVLVLLTYPFVYLPVAARLRGLPADLEESSRTLGAGAAATFGRVVLPQLRASMIAGALLVFLYTISDFGAVQLLRYDTMTRSIYADRLFDTTSSFALGLVLATVALAAVAVERRVARRERRDTRREVRPLVVRLGRCRAAVATATWALVALALAAPVAVLGWWAARGLSEGRARTGSAIADPSSLAGPAANTALVSVAAAVVAVAVVLPVAYASARRRERLADAANGVIVGGFALPGLVIALALVFWALEAPGPAAALYQTLPLLVLAYVLNFGALSLGSAQVAVRGVPGSLDDAARTLGAGRLRRLVTVEAPLIAPGVAAGAGLVLLSAMKELPATLLLAPPGFTTLATRVWSASEDSFFADASIAALLLISLSAVLTWALVIRPARSMLGSDL